MAKQKETKEIQIPKKSGGTRLIVVPEPRLKRRLRAVARHVARQSESVCHYAHGFVPGRNVVTAAMKHRGFGFTLSCDLEDFFDNCKFPSKAMLLPAVPGKSLEECKGVERIEVSSPTPEAKYNGRFAQGLPSSPAIANITAVPMDIDIVLWLRERDPKAVYTRYADDLSISSDNKDMLMELKAALPEIVAKHGHKCHPRKWSLQSAKFGKRTICGVNIGSKDQPLTATRKQRRRLRAMQHNIDKGDNRPTTLRRVKGLREWTRMRLPIIEIVNHKFRGAESAGITTDDIRFVLEDFVRTRRWTLRRVVERLPCKYVVRAKRYFDEQSKAANLTIADTRLRRLGSHDSKKFAFTVAATFGPSWQTWLDACVAAGVSFHDACYWLPKRILPEDGLGQQLIKWTRANPDMPKRFGELALIAEAWLSLTAEERKLPLQELLKRAKTAKYANAKSSAFAVVAAECAVPADKYDKYETKWLASITKAAYETIPRGVVYVAGDYLAEMLARDNPVALWAGKLVNCCQYPGGGAGSSAWHSVTSTKGAIFAVYYKDKLVAQSWTWRKKDTIVFDNVEALSRDYKELPDIYAAAAAWLIDKLGIREVRVGDHNDIDVSRWSKVAKSAKLEPPKNCYSDANTSQRILLVSDKPRAKKNERTEEVAAGE